MNPAIAMWLWWLMWSQAPAAQCTRCGGAHPVSQCRWPVVEKERS